MDVEMMRQLLYMRETKCNKNKHATTIRGAITIAKRHELAQDAKEAGRSGEVERQLDLVHIKLAFHRHGQKQIDQIDIL